MGSLVSERFKMKAIHFALVLTFLTLAYCVHLVPRPNYRPFNEKKTLTNRWHRFHSILGGAETAKWYPKKYGPLPVSCHYDCQLEYHTSFNLPLMDDETECPTFLRTRILETSFYRATNWKHICFHPNVTLCTYCLEIQTLREFGQIQPNRPQAMHLRQSCKYMPPEEG